MTFWDEYEDAPPAPPKAPPLPKKTYPALNDTAGVCAFCGCAVDDVLLGVCAACAPEED